MNKLAIAFLLTLIPSISYAQGLGGLANIFNPNAMQVTPTGSTTPRGLADRFSDVINVKDWGACGISDATTQIQAAIDRAEAESRKLWFPACNYYHSGTLTADGIEILMDKDATLIATATSGTATNALTLTGTGVALRGQGTVTTLWEGTRQATQASAGVLVTAATDFIVEGIKTPASASVGIFVTGSTKGKVQGNTVYNTLADGIHITGESSEILVSGNNVYGTGDDKIAVVSYNSNSGVSHDVIIEKNIVTGGAARGISVVGGSRVSILDNLVKDVASNAGIYVASESSFNTAATTDILINSNNIYNSGKATGELAPIYVTGRLGYESDRITISNNIIDTSPTTGIRVNGSGAPYINNIIISGNHLYETAGSCVKLQGVDTAVVSNNMIEGCGSYGLYTGETNWNTGTLTVSDNTFKRLNTSADGAADAIIIYNAGWTKTIVTGNTQTLNGNTLDTFFQANTTDLNIEYANNFTETSSRFAGVSSAKYGRLALEAEVARNQANSAFGTASGNKISSGQNNTVIGRQSGDEITTGSNNTVLGYQVGSTTLATGSNNILIGTSSAVDTPAAGTSNYLEIQDTIFGDVSVKSSWIGAGTVATNATDGFLYIPTTAGTPTGTPTTRTGFAPIVVDTTNNKLYFYSGGAWRDAGP